MIGQSLRQYRITASLGRGGMGEVWLARDTTLERDVAIKTLPDDSDADAATRKERFFREARAASALNHPSIITIYEINTDQGIDFIAMEYVEGRTLADLLEHGPLPIDQARQFAQQISEALGRAHRAGIVHRDLKPRNIMVTNDGLVKVLDFGLAKIACASDADARDAATQVALTRVGTTVGTLGYMSPEQAIGDAVDARSDVFSFGVILYEMLTGRLPFTGKTMSEVLQQLHFADPPRLESLRTDVPAALRNLVARALRKRPDDRFANMSEVTAALTADKSTDRATKVFVTAPVPPAAAPPRSAWRGASLAVVGLLVAALAVFAIVAQRRSPPQVLPVAANLTPAVQAAAAPPVQTTVPPPVLPAVQAAVQAADKPAGNSVDRAAPEPAVHRVDGGATNHMHWGRIGDVYRAEPGRQAEAATAYRRAIEIVEKQLEHTTGDADLESWRGLYLAKLGDHAGAVAALDALVKRTDLTAQVLFRMAVAYEIAEARQRAMMALPRAVRAGYPVRAIFAESELAALRTDPRFQRLANATQARKRPVRQ